MRTEDYSSPTDRIPVTIQLGRTRIPSDDLANVVGGALVVLDQAVDAPLDVYANDRLIARGEIVVVNEKFCVKVTELVTHVNEVA
ncbi:MAG: FliM/FliN family flagellar motor switch protein [Planctomycetota bacterium]|nr:FliM/FliN family flagellar motor switch protein [Planctomycetota bacterium]